MTRWPKIPSIAHPSPMQREERAGVPAARKATYGVSYFELAFNPRGKVSRERPRVAKIGGLEAMVHQQPTRP
jgi:hypothetical protein